MIIAHIIWSFKYGGIQTLLVDLVNQQILNHSVHIFVVNDNVSSSLIDKISKDVHIHFIGRKVGHLSVFKILKFNFILHRTNPEIIHCHFHNQIKLLFFFKKKKLHLTVHDVNHPLKNMKHYSRIYSISESVREDLLNRGNIDSVVIHNGICLESIQIKKNYRLNICKVLQVSRLIHSKKGQDILIKAFHHLVNHYHVENIELYFIGQGDSFEYLKQLSYDLGISEKVIFLGYQDSQYISAHLQDYDIFVQPSRYEGFGITVIEAMTAGLPVLVSDIGGPMEIIKNGRYGYHFKTQDEINCAKQLNTIIAHLANGEFIQKAEEIRDYVSENYSIKTVAEKYLKNYASAY